MPKDKNRPPGGGKQYRPDHGWTGPRKHQQYKAKGKGTKHQPGSKTTGSCMLAKVVGQIILASVVAAFAAITFQVVMG